MRILVTGASGFIGAHLMTRLAADGHNLSVLASPRFRSERLAHLAGRYGVVPDATAARAELVYHLASTPLDASTCDAQHAEAIAGGTVRLLGQLGRGEAPQRLVLAGSAAEYGSGEGWREDEPTRPDTAFGVLKAAAAALARLASRAPVVHLRLFTPFGPGEAEGRLIPSVILSALGAGPVRLRTNGLERRDYFWVGDLVDALIEAGRRPMPEFEPRYTAVNLCSGTARSARAVAHRLLEMLGAAPLLETGTAPAALSCLSGSGERAAEWLGWRPRVSFEDGLSRSIRFWEERFRHDCHLAR